MGIQDFGWTQQWSFSRNWTLFLNPDWEFIPNWVDEFQWQFGCLIRDQCKFVSGVNSPNFYTKGWKRANVPQRLSQNLKSDSLSSVDGIIYIHRICSLASSSEWKQYLSCVIPVHWSGSQDKIISLSFFRHGCCPRTTVKGTQLARRVLYRPCWARSHWQCVHVWNKTWLQWEMYRTSLNSNTNTGVWNEVTHFLPTQG